MDATVYLSTAELAERVLSWRDVAERWGDESALVGYTVGGLSGHLARAVLTLDAYLDRPAPDGEPLDAAGYLVQVLSGHDPVASELHQSVRARAAQEAAAGPDALVARLREARLGLGARLAAVDGAARIAVLDGITMRVAAYLETRLVELVVHLDDLAVSVGREVADEIAPEAYATVASVLAQVAAVSAGGMATVRSLARRERHPEAVRAL